MKVQAKQINALMGQGAWRTSATLPSSGTTLDVSAHFSGKVGGGSDTQTGVYTSAPQNRVFLRRASDGKAIADNNGRQIFARLAEAAGTWTLSFYTQAGGVESAFNWSGHADANSAFHYRWCETVQLANNTPTSVVDNGESIDEFQASSPLLHGHQLPDFITITSNGQTALTLAATPKFGVIELYVNGLLQGQGAGKDYTLTGSAITWLDRHFTLQTTDEVVALYEV